MNNAKWNIHFISNTKFKGIEQLTKLLELSVVAVHVQMPFVHLNKLHPNAPMSFHHSIFLAKHSIESML
jgi:hypothetical protein